MDTSKPPATLVSMCSHLTGWHTDESTPGSPGCRVAAGHDSRLVVPPSLPPSPDLLIYDARKPVLTGGKENFPNST